MKTISLLRQYSKRVGAFFLGVLGGFFLFAFAYVVVTDPGDNLTLVESGVRSAANGEHFLTGTLRNNTDDVYAFVQANLSLVDENGSVVRDTFVTTRDLEAGETWRFEVPIRADEAIRAVLNGQCGRRYDVQAKIPIPPKASAQTIKGARNHLKRLHRPTLAMLTETSDRAHAAHTAHAHVTVTLL
jgi:hypothetical protein